MAFRLPQFANEYIERVIKRTEDLIHRGVWDLDLLRLRRWLACFQTDEARYFTACILDSLVYRSEPQTLAIARQLFQRAIPDLFRIEPCLDLTIRDWLSALSSRAAVPIRLVPVHKPDDPPTKSGFIVTRMLRRHLGIDDRIIITPAVLATLDRSGLSTVIFVDDFLGTGDQFSTFARQCALTDLMDELHVVYAPLTAHQDGIARLRSEFPKLHVAYVELLTDQHNVFHGESRCFEDGVNTPSDAQAYLLHLYSSLGIAVSSGGSFGYGNLGLTYAFRHACPNNSLPLLWWSRAASFSPLFDR